MSRSRFRRWGMHEARVASLSVGLFLIAQSSEAAAEDVCSAFQLVVDDSGVIGQTATRCPAGQHAYASLKGFAPGWKVSISTVDSGSLAAPQACPPALGLGAGIQCVDLQHAGATFTVAVNNGTKNIKMKQADGTLGDSLAVTIQPGQAPAPVPGGGLPLAPAAAAPASPCDKYGTDPAKRVWCLAYADAIAQLWPGEDATKKEPGFDTWYLTRAHIEHRYQNRYALFYTSDGQPVAPVPQVTERDTIVLAVVSSDPTKTTTVDEVKVMTCDAADPVRIGGSAVTPAFRPADNITAPPVDVTKRYQIRVAKACSADKGIIVSVRTSDAQSSTSINIPTLAIYHFTVGLGFIYDFTHTVDYRAAPVKGQTVPIIVQDDHVQGLTPPIVIVSWRPFGVDTARPRWPGVHEWIGISLGINLTAPLDHLYVGGLLEPYPGLGVIGGAHLHTSSSLASGYQVGDRFPGGGDVPVDKRWDFSKTGGFIGLELDASLFGKLLKVIQ